MTTSWKLYRILNDQHERQPIPESGFDGLTYSPEAKAIEGSSTPLTLGQVVGTEKDGRRIAIVRTDEHPELRLCFEAAPAMTADDFAKSLLGTWTCHHVDQEQSEDEEDEYGEYDDYGESRRQEASQTEFANTTIEFLDDKQYKLVGEDHSCSHGTWSFKESSLRLEEADDCINGYEGFSWVSFNGSDRVAIGWKLNDDSHDGLDTLILEFGRG